MLKMAIIGFHFKKLNAERKKSPIGKINVSSSLTITTVKEAKVNMGSDKQKGIEFSFNFKTVYQPDIASIDIDGAVVYLGSSEKVSTALQKWDKEKKLPKDVLESIYNAILPKCNVEVLLMAKEMQLPPHVPFRKVKVN